MFCRTARTQIAQNRGATPLLARTQRAQTLGRRNPTTKPPIKPEDTEWKYKNEDEIGRWITGMKPEAEAAGQTRGCRTRRSNPRMRSPTVKPGEDEPDAETRGCLARRSNPMSIPTLKPEEEESDAQTRGWTRGSNTRTPNPTLQRDGGPDAQTWGRRTRRSNPGVIEYSRFLCCITFYCILSFEMFFMAIAANVKINQNNLAITCQMVCDLLGIRAVLQNLYSIVRNQNRVAPFYHSAAISYHGSIYM